MFSSANTEVKLKFRRIDFLRKVYILVKRENFTLKRRALPNTFRYHKWNCLKNKIKVFPLACWKEGMSPLVFINAVLDSNNNGKEE